MIDIQELILPNFQQTESLINCRGLALRDPEQRVCGGGVRIESYSLKCIRCSIGEEIAHTDDVLYYIS